jgi:uncharacterized protein (TIGR03083 family)
VFDSWVGRNRWRDRGSGPPAANYVGPMDHNSLVDASRAECAALIFALESQEADDIVPTCAGWEVRDLAVHVGNFCGFWTDVLRDGTGQPKTPFPDPPVGPELIPWLQEACAVLIGELAITAPQTPVWTWFDADQTAGFVIRRSAHELAVHRYDAQSVSRIFTPIPTELAVDGIDEVLDVLVTTREHPGSGSGRTMTLRSAETGAEWLITLAEEHVEVERRFQDAAPNEGSDLIVSGTTSDLELTLYHRPTLSPVDVHGDYTVLEEWHRQFTF